MTKKTNKRKPGQPTDKVQPPVSDFAGSVESSDEQSKVDEAKPATGANELQQELEELKQRFQRLGADYQNYQKRAEQRIEQSCCFAREALVKSMLPVLDNFRHTLEKSGDIQDPSAILQAVQIVYDQLVGDLEKTGLSHIEIKPGDMFDPTLHEAMLHEENEEFPENTIVRELAGGYVMNDHTLRPARVSVAKPPQQQDNKAISEEEQPPGSSGFQPE